MGNVMFKLKHNSTTTPVKRPFVRTTRVSRYQKGKTNLDLLEQEAVSGSGISWVICKSVPRPRQNNHASTTPLSFFTGQMPFLPPNQQLHSTEGKMTIETTNNSVLNSE